MEHIVQECEACLMLFTATIETPYCYHCTLGTNDIYDTYDIYDLQEGSPASSGSFDEEEQEEHDNQQVKEHLQELSLDDEHMQDLVAAYEAWQAESA